MTKKLWRDMLGWGSIGWIRKSIKKTINREREVEIEGKGGGTCRKNRGTGLERRGSGRERGWLGRGVLTDCCYIQAGFDVYGLSGDETRQLRDQALSAAIRVVSRATSVCSVGGPATLPTTMATLPTATALLSTPLPILPVGCPCPFP